MADKTIKVKVDVETDVEPSIAALKALKKQLKETAAGSEEFTALQKQIDDVQDSLAGARTGAGNFTEVLGQLPGPIGAIGGQASGLITTLKQFSGLKISNLQSSFVELGKDVTDIAKGFMDLTGITKVYTTLNAALSKSFIAVGIGETAAAAGAKAFAAALTATGIGAIIVGLGLLIANWDKVSDAITGATAESKTYEEAQAEVTKSVSDFNKKLIDVQNAFKGAREGTISKKDALQQYNDTLGKTIGYAGSLEQAESLMSANTAVVIEGIKLRTQANVFYAKSAEAAAKAVSGEDVDPSFWESAGNFIKTGGNYALFAGAQVTTLGENYMELNATANKFAKEGDKLSNQAIENDKKLKKGLAKPPDFSGTTKASNDALNEIKKGLEEARLTLLSEQAKELEQVRIKYDELAAKAKKFGKDTKIIEQAREKENSAIRDKFAKQELDKAEKAAKELSDIRTKQLETAFAREEGLINLRVAKGEITEKEYQIQLYNLRKKYAVLNQSLGQDEIDSALKARKDFNEEYKGELKTQLDNELRTLTISRNEKEIQLKDELDSKKITKKEYSEQLLAIDKEYNAKEAEVRKQNQSFTEAGIKEVLAKQQDILKTQLDNKQITEEQYGQKSLELARKYSDLTTAFAYETLQKEEADLKTALDKNQITQSEYDAKLLENRKAFADVVQQQAAVEMAAQEANLKAALDLRLSSIQTASQTEQDKLKESFNTQLTDLQTSLQNKTITQEQFDSKKIELENQNGSKLLEVQNKFTSDSLSAQSNYDTQLTGLKEAALVKNKELVAAEIELNKFQLEDKKKTAEEERGIIALRLQSQIEALDTENAKIEGDFEQDLERLAIKRELLAEQETNELANTELNEFQKTEIRQKYANARKNITDEEIANEKAAQQAKVDLQLAYLDLFSQFGSTLQALAGKNKSLQIAGIVIEQAAAIGKIVVNTGIANAKALAASPLTFGQPWIAINTISAGLSIATSIAGAAKAIQQINSVNTNNPSPTGGGAGGSVSGAGAAPTAPTVAATQAPQIQSGQGINASSQIAQTLGAQKDVVKAYVVSGDVSSQQALDRRTSRAATFSGG